MFDLRLDLLRRLTVMASFPARDPFSQIGIPAPATFGFFAGTSLTAARRRR